MPRAGWTKPETDQRLSDHLAVALLTRAYPPALVDDVIATTGRLEERHRLLPARVVLYHVLAMALFNEGSYEEVMRRLLEGLAWQEHWKAPCHLPTKAAIFKARTRLGPEPLAELFKRAVRPLAAPQTSASWYRGLHVVSPDRLDLPLLGSTSHTNGHPKNLLAMTGLVEAGTDVVFSVEISPPGASGSGDPINHVADGMLGLAARARNDAGQEVKRRGGELIWTTEDPDLAEPTDPLPDGSFLQPGSNGTVRILGRNGHLPGLLATTLLDPDEAPAAELRALYDGRVTLGGAFDHLRVRERAPALVPRSKGFDAVLQEVYGFLLAHYAVRSMLLSQPPRCSV